MEVENHELLRGLDALLLGETPSVLTAESLLDCYRSVLVCDLLVTL